jgi:hypothetical protein
MQTDTYANLYSLVKGLTGNTSFTSSEDTLIQSFINRRIYNAYRRSTYWPRYLVVGEARTATDSIIPFTQVSLDSIDTFMRVFKEQPYQVNSVVEYEFLVTADGAQVTGDSSGATTYYVDYKKRWEGPYNSTSNDDIPLEFFHYAAHGAVSDFLRYDKQLDKAMAEEQNAENYLMLELGNFMNQRNVNLAGKRIRTHNTQQARYSR